MKKIIIFALLQLGLLSIGEAATFNAIRWQTSAGTPVVFYPAMSVPMLDIQLAFAAGSAYDGAHFGLSALTTDLLNQGNDKLDATQVAEQLADTGAQFSADTGRDMVAVRLKTLTQQGTMQKAIQVFTQILSRPDFPENAFQREKKQQLTAIKQMKQSPNNVASLNFFAHLYQSHPYAHPILGDEESVNNIEKAQVFQFYKTYFNAHNTVLVLVGAIDLKTAKLIAEQVTGSLPKGSAAPSIPKAKPLQKAEQITLPFPSSQTMIRLGQLGIDHHSPHYFPLLVGNYILGGGSLVSRLAIEVREKRGLTYGIYSQFMPMPADGPFLISLSTKNNQANEALTVTLDVLKSFLSKGPNEEELAAAKQYLTGSFPLSLASNSSIASILLKMSFYHLPDNYLDTYIKNVENVSLAEINKAFQAQLHPQKLLTVTVGQK